MHNMFFLTETPIAACLCAHAVPGDSLSMWDPHGRHLSTGSAAAAAGKGAGKPVFADRRGRRAGAALQGTSSRPGTLRRACSTRAGGARCSGLPLRTPDQAEASDICKVSHAWQSTSLHAYPWRCRMCTSMHCMIYTAMSHIYAAHRKML